MKSFQSLDYFIISFIDFVLTCFNIKYGPIRYYTLKSSYLRLSKMIYFFCETFFIFTLSYKFFSHLNQIFFLARLPQKRQLNKILLFLQLQCPYLNYIYYEVLQCKRHYVDLYVIQSCVRSCSPAGKKINL